MKYERQGLEHVKLYISEGQSCDFYFKCDGKLLEIFEQESKMSLTIITLWRIVE